MRCGKIFSNEKKRKNENNRREKANTMKGMTLKARGVFSEGNLHLQTSSLGSLSDEFLINLKIKERSTFYNF